MNETQHAKYIRCWITVVRANHWVMRKGRLAEDAAGADRSPWHQLVWSVADRMASEKQMAVVPDHLRKACHVVAFNKDKSSKVLTNEEFDRLLILWGNERELRQGGMKGLLVDPLDLASINAWNDYERVERLNLVRRLHQLAPDAVISEISKNAFGTEFWVDLDIPKMHWLMRELKNGRSFVPKTEDQPF